MFSFALVLDAAIAWMDPYGCGGQRGKHCSTAGGHDFPKKKKKLLTLGISTSVIPLYQRQTCR